MPVKFSSLDNKGISNTSYVIGLYNDPNSSTTLGNCKISITDFAKKSELTSVDEGAVHIYNNETIQGNKTFGGVTTFSNNTTFNNPSTFNNTATFKGNTTFTNPITVSNTSTFSKKVTINNDLKVTGTIDGKSIYDGNGNNIVNTYATKTELQQKSSFNLFDVKWSDYKISDQSWLRADTFSWQLGTTYSDAYNHLVSDFNNGEVGHTDTINGISVNYRLCSDGHKVCLQDQEQNIVDMYNATGVAWYYILDTTNKKFKLPRTKHGFNGIRNIVGNYIEPGLPNITGKFPNGNEKNNYTPSGAFYKHSTETASTAWDGTKYPNVIVMDASRSNSIYGNSTTVQPPATQMYLYFYVGKFSATATEQTAGLNTELFNNKLDRDLSNITANADYVVEWKMPSNSSPSWYRKYKSGWIEQGTTISLSNEGTWTFPKAFTNTNYLVHASPYGFPSSSTSDKNWIAFPLVKSTNNCTFRVWDSDDNSSRTGTVILYAAGC